MSIPRKLCPRCQASLPADAPACLRAGCGHQFAPDVTRMDYGAYDRTRTMQGVKRSRSSLTWLAVLGGICAFLGFAAVGLHLQSQPPDLTPLFVPGKGSISRPGGPFNIGGTRSVVILWSIQAHNAGWGRIKNTGTETIRRVSVWKPSLDTDEVQGFSVSRPGKELAHWDSGVTSTDLEPGKSLHFWLADVYSFPTSLTVEDGAGNEVPFTQEIEPLRVPANQPPEFVPPIVSQNGPITRPANGPWSF